MADSIFKDKTLLITGGTGSFGHTVLKHFLTTDIGEIRIFSRDEKKQAICAMNCRPSTRVRQQGQVLHRRCAQPQSIRDAMPGVELHLPRSCTQAGAQLRVLPHAGRADEHHRHRQCAARRH